MQADEGQLKSKTLDVDDTDPSTEGGPPGWIAWFTVFLMSFILAGLALLLMWWFDVFA